MIPGSYADGLRALGVLLDGEHALALSIINDEHAVLVTWHTRDGTMARRRFEDEELAELSRQAQGLRGLWATLHASLQRLRPDAAPERLTGRGELLRTLGQVLDQQGLHLDAVIEAPTRYRVVGTVGGAYVQAVYSSSDLQAMSREQRSRRRG